MKSISLFCVAALLGLASVNCNAQTWSLEYGNENGKVAFYNSNNTPNFAEDAPYGPLSFRVIKNNLWVLDSVAGKLSQFDEKGSLIKTIVVPGLEGFKLLEDFALDGKDQNNPESVWIANAADRIIRKISVADGKVLAQIGGEGNDSFKIIQVNQLEIDAGGRLYVGDIGRSKLCVFSATGVFLREYPWQSTGFVVDKHANLHMIHYGDNVGYFYRVYSPKGQLINSTHLGFINNTNLKINSLADDGSLILSMIPDTGFKGVLDLVKVNKSGEIIEQQQYVPPVLMNRYVSVSGNKIFHAEADFLTAPANKFIVKPLEWGKKKNSVPAALEMETKRKTIAKIPSEISSNLVGLRVYKNTAFVMGANGKYIMVDLSNGNINKFKVKANKVIDYDIVVGKVIYLDDQGMIGGYAFPSWSKGPYDSCRIEACAQGVVLSGGSNAYFLAKNSDSSVTLPELYMNLPINNGMFWSMKQNSEKRWEANLYDYSGKMTKKIYTFSEYFNPSNLEMGPNGVEGELLVSATEGNARTLSLVGTNGRMFWKINGPQKVCNRDVAFEPISGLLFLEKEQNGEVILSQWTFSSPEG